MKITRSALKNLIKEEMNRINEATTVKGDDVVKMGDAVSAMSDDDLIPVLSRWIKGGNLTGLEMFDGVGFVKRISAKNQGTYKARMADGSMIPTLGVQLTVGVFPKGPNEPIYVTAEEAITSPTNSRHYEVPQEEWDAAEGLVREAIVQFNAQNDGKGSMVTIDGETLRTSDTYAGRQNHLGQSDRWFSPSGAQLSPANPS